MSPSRPVPAVSIAISIHDEAPYLGAAIDSLLAQTFRDFEILLVDDGSPVPDRLQALAGQDPRIRLFRNDHNLGLPLSLNRAIAAAQAPLVARMDGDDICLPDRLARQVAAFKVDPGLGLLGGQAVTIDPDGNPLEQLDLPLTDAEIRWHMYFANPLIHPSTMFRADLFHRAGGYDPGFPQGQDYDLWDRMLCHGRAANLNAILLQYRLHPAAVSSSHRHGQIQAADRIRQRAWTRAGQQAPAGAAEYGHCWTLQAGGLLAEPPSAGTVAALAGLLSAIAARTDDGALPAASIACNILASLRLSRVGTGGAGLSTLRRIARLGGPRSLAVLAAPGHYWAGSQDDVARTSVSRLPPGLRAVPWAALARHRRIWIYGCGTGGRRLLDLLCQLPACPVIAGFVDSERRGQHLGYPLIDRSGLDGLAEGDGLLVATVAWREILPCLPSTLPIHIAEVDGIWRLLQVYHQPLPE